uniref:Protein krueppel n=1 Tax=Anopheles atroparvus TaxID=41427 RepID=A0AAG5DI80_ANOAO
MLVNKTYLLAMASSVGNVLDICRFCLCHNGLIPLPEATTSLLTIQDIEHFTGIQITDEEQSSFALCDKCCNILENSVAFRSTCLDNDIIFKQLFSVVLESVLDDAEVNESTARIEHSLCSVSADLHGATKDELLCNESEYEIGTEYSLFDDARSSTSESADAMEMMDAPNKKKSIQRRKLGMEGTLKTRNPSTTLDGKKKRKQRSKQRKPLCDICGKLVKGYREHVNDFHTHERKYACPHCPVKMANRTNMKTHVKLVHEKKITKSCELCGTGFIHPNTFLRHMATKHGIGKTYECKICSKSFGRDAYNYHMNKWHKAPQEVTCTICSKICSSRQMFRKHLRVHSTEQPYACRLCPKRFKTSTGRKVHELTHTGIRYACSFCEKSYSYQSLLNNHIRKEHADKIVTEENNSNLTGV